MDEHENTIRRCRAEDEPISCGILYRRDWLVKAGLYDPSFRHLEERELRHRLGDYYRVDYLRMPFYRYRRHDSNKTLQEKYRMFKRQYDAKQNLGTTESYGGSGE